MKSLEDLAAARFINGSAKLYSTNAFARPADTTAYASGDLIANSTTAGSVVVPSITTVNPVLGGLVRAARVRKSGTSVTTCSIRVHLFSAAPTLTNGDNGAWLPSSSANYLGALDTTVDKAFSDGAVGRGVPLVGSDIAFSSTTLYIVLEARSSYTPASAETFTVTLEVVHN